MSTKVAFVGVAVGMPGTNGGFTMAAFKADEVPPGSKLYLTPPRQWHKCAPDVADNQYREFIVAVKRASSPEKVFVLSAYYANNYRDDDLQDQDGNEYVPDGWYVLGVDTSGEYNELFQPMLESGDEVLGWQYLPEWECSPKT